MRATILLPTARSDPKFGWACDSLARQDPALLAETELVCVDAKMWPVRHDLPVGLAGFITEWAPMAERMKELYEASARLRDLGVQVVHIPPRDCRWQGPARLTKSDLYALSAARNSGLIVARGERVILLDDCTVVDENWLAAHFAFGPMALVAGTFCTYRTATVESGRIIGGDVGPYGWDHRRATYPEKCRTNGAMLYGLNASFPLDAAIAANGYDEVYDGGGGGSEDCDGGIRMERSGFAAYWNPEAIVYQILETHEEVFGHAGWGMPRKAKKGPKEVIVRRDGQLHFRNEKWIEQLVLDDIGRTEPLGNNFSLAELREEYARTGKMPSVPFISGVDFDGQPLAEMGE